jgi:hypothetical protein
LLATNAKGDQLYVLMPHTDKDHTGCGKTEHVPPHKAVVVYNPLYERITPPAPPGMDIKYEGIEGVDVTLGGSAAPGTSIVLDPMLANLTAASGAKVPTKLATGPFDASILASRVSFVRGLPSAATYDGGVYWDFNGKTDVELATAVHLLINMQNDQLDLATVHGKKTLYPILGSIAIAFFHSPDDELPGRHGHVMHPPKVNDPAPHFPAYYSIAKTAKSECPKFKKTRAISTTKGIFPVTCLMAAADLG